MNNYMKTIALLACMCMGLLAHAQELLCNVSINASQIQSDKQVFDDMQKTLSEYINFNTWTDDVYETQERIRANIQIVVSQRPTADRFVATATIQLYRPVYNTTYETLLLNISDDKFTFNYVPFQQLQFSDNVYTDNLTALLNFYVYLILGFDYDSFAPNGGNVYFRKAQEIVNLAGSQSNEQGWRSSESQRNRYWIIENLTNSRYRRFHDVLYKYHREGLDMMESDPAKGRKAILETLREMQNLNRQNPLLLLTRMFLDAKDKELVKVFAEAFPNDKQEFLRIMQDLDPSNLNQYNSIMK
ncbi:MAG: DUF4835 family protein [Bacteroidetes bacterium]|nr:MAG: DUF4835 family protein [Bacteroidota bacterium]